MNNFFWKILPYTAKWIWDRSIFSIIKPSFDIILFSRFLKICTDLQAICSIERKIVFVIVSEQFCIHMLQISCKSSEILEQCHVKWWLKYRNNRSVSLRLSCNSTHPQNQHKISFLNSKIVKIGICTNMWYSQYLTNFNRFIRSSI